MADIMRRGATEARDRHSLKKQRIANTISIFVLCTAGAFGAPAHAQSWLNNVVGTVTGQVEQGVQQNILGNGTQTQQSTPTASPSQQALTAAPSYSPSSSPAPSWAPPPQSSLPNCDQTTPSDVNGTVQHTPCTFGDNSTYDPK